MKIFQFILRVMITPALISLVMIPAYFAGLIINQFTFIAFLVVSGVTGQVLEFYLQRYQQNKNGKKVESEENVLKEKDLLSELPEEVQTLIKEADALYEDKK